MNCSSRRSANYSTYFGVFFGTWSLDAALAVAGGQAKAGATLNGLQSLVQKSLVIVERGPGGLRYRLLESVRAFACARLEAMDRTDQARLLHARYFARLAATAGEKLLEDDQVVWMDHLDLEWPNLRAAWEWLLTRPVHRAHAVELMVGLRWHFWIRGKYTEAMQWYSEAEALIEECGASDQARLFNGHAITLLHARRLEDALLHARRAAACAESSDLAWEHAYALGVQAWLAVALGRPQDAKSELRKGRGTQPTVASTLDRRLHATGARFQSVYAQDHAQAVTDMREVASIFDSAADRHMRMFATVQLALQQFLTGDSIAARGNTLRGLSFARQIANPRGLTGICETSAYIAAQEGHAPLAARLLGAAEAGRQMSGAPQFPYWMKLHDTAWEEICARIGQTAANDIFAAGELAGPRACAPQAAAFLQSETRSG
jgi:tetratricopeptide (TPR) repeat protein